MVAGTLRILPPPERRIDVLEILRSIQGKVATQRGCAAYHIYLEDGPDAAIVLVERWETEAALEAHLRSEQFRLILSALELAATAPEVCFDHVSGSEGMEVIERARTSDGHATRFTTAATIQGAPSGSPADTTHTPQRRRR
jgi:quinol monooxygenase YgiN